jgi:hypothetical protein
MAVAHRDAKMTTNRKGTTGQTGHTYRCVSRPVPLSPLCGPGQRGHSGTLSRLSRCRAVLIVEADRQEPLVAVRLSLARGQLGDKLAGARS